MKVFVKNRFNSANSLQQGDVFLDKENVPYILSDSGVVVNLFTGTRGQISQFYGYNQVRIAVKAELTIEV